MVYGARQSLVYGVVSTAIGLTAGARWAPSPAASAPSAAFGGWVDTAMMRCVDVMLSIPSLLLAVSIAAVLGQNSYSVMIAIGAAQVPIFARLLRGSMLSQGQADYVLAADALGLRKGRIVMSHVLPNSVGPTIVQATLNLATAIIEVAALSYLGLGTSDPAVAEWGRMLVAAQDRFDAAPGWRCCRASRSRSRRSASRCSARRCVRPSTPDEAMTMTVRPTPRHPCWRSTRPRGDLRHPGLAAGARRGPGLLRDRPGQHVGLVGESGSGKSVTSLAIMGLLPKRGVRSPGEVVCDGRGPARGRPQGRCRGCGAGTSRWSSRTR